MDILENLQTLKDKHFWPSIEDVEIDSINAAINAWKQEQNYNNALLDFFGTLQGFHFTKEDIEFYYPDALNALSTEDCVLLFENIDKIQNNYIKVLVLGFLWKYRKLPTSNDNFKAVVLSLNIYLDILDKMCLEIPVSKSSSLHLYLPQILEYCLYTASCLKHPIKNEFITRAKHLATLEYTNENFYFIVSALRMLVSHTSIDDIKALIPTLEGLLQKTNNDYNKQHQIYDIIIQVAKIIEDKKMKIEMLQKKAALFEIEGRQDISIHREIYLLKKAASIYITIPEYREKWEQIMQEIENKSPRILDTLVSVPMGGKIDRSLILESEKNIAGKSFQDSLKEIAKCIVSIPTLQDIERVNSQGILSDIFSTNILDEKGFTASVIDDRHSHPMSFYMTVQWFWAHTCTHALNPMLSRIALEHFFTIQDLLPICAYNPFVPIGREIIFAKGLYYFLKQDFITSSSLLVPQLENSFRNLLYGTKPITYSKSDGSQPYKIEMKWLLDTLLNENRITNKLHFNLDLLLCDNYFNVRNEIAHGLLTGNNFYSPAVCILNWFIFYFTCYTTLFYDEIVATQQERAEIK